MASEPGLLQRAWRRRGPLAWALWPVSLLYGALVWLRRMLYRWGWLKTERASVPVIVVGNVVAGGAGKTPVVIALVRYLQSRGVPVGVVSRGYGRQLNDCREVLAKSVPSDVGDEPLLIAQTTGAPVFVAPRRIDAIRALIARHPQTALVVVDDGLQHLALARDFEICVFNEQGLFNGMLLPAGPLREPWPRAVNVVLHTGKAPPGPAPAFALERRLAPYAVRSDASVVPLSELRGQPLRALAGIANPQSFFDMLTAQGLTLAQSTALPDHYDFRGWQAQAQGQGPLLCTQKDAAKLWQVEPDALAVALQLTVDDGFYRALEQWLNDQHLTGLSSPSN